MVVNLKPPGERKLHVQQVIERLRERVAGLDGVRTFFTPWQDLQLGAANLVSRYQYTLISMDTEELIRAAANMRPRMAAMPQLTDVIRSDDVNGLEAGVGIDRQRAAR